MTSAAKTMPKVWQDFMPSNEDMLLDKVEQDEDDQELAVFDAWVGTPDGKKQIEQLIRWGNKYNETHPERYTVEESMSRLKSYFLDNTGKLAE